METKQEIVTFRIEADLSRKMKELSEKLSEPKSNIIRKAILEFAQKSAELNEIKSIVAKNFAQGKISFEKMIELLGYKEAKKIASYTELAKHSIISGLK